MPTLLQFIRLVCLEVEDAPTFEGSIAGESSESDMLDS
jgi:hypothetical protein